MSSGRSGQRFAGGEPFHDSRCEPVAPLDPQPCVADILKVAAQEVLATQGAVIGLIAEELGIDSGPIAWIAGLDLEYVGFTLVGLFVVTWLIALAIWRFGRIEQRWTAAPTSIANTGRGHA